MDADALLSPIALMKSHRDPAYLEFVRSRPSCVSGSRENVIAHHLRMFGGGGIGLKPSDYLTVPLTFDEHQELHNKGEAAFWHGRAVLPMKEVEALLVRCLRPGTDPEELFNTPTARMVGDGRVRVLIEAVATWRRNR